MGVVGSILTICQVVAGGLSRVTELYSAPTEVKALQVSFRVSCDFAADYLKDQLQSLCDIIESTGVRDRPLASAHLQRATARIEKILAELHLLISAKLLRLSGGSPRARRRGWVKIKPKVLSLCDSLKKCSCRLLRCPKPGYTVSGTDFNIAIWD